MDNNLPSEINKLLINWKEKIEKREKIHRKKAIRFRRAYYIIGIPATILSGLTTVGELSMINECSSNLIWSCILQSILGTIITILVGIQTVVPMMTRFTENKTASDRYQALLRTIETILATKNKGDPANILNNVRDVFDDIVKVSPISNDDDMILKYSIFDRETRQKSEHQLKKRSNNLKPATEEELTKINKGSEDVCIDIDLDEEKKNFYVDPELRYQIDRFNQNYSSEKNSS